MKILFLTNRLAMGGIETNLVLLARELRRRDHDILVAAAPGVITADLEAAGARTYALDVELRRPSKLIADIRKLREILRSERPDVIHSFAASASILLALASPVRRPRAFTVSSVMGLQDDPDESTLRTHARNAALTLRAERILLIAPAIERMMRQLPIRGSRLLRHPVVGIARPEATEIDAAAGVRTHLGLRPSVPVVVTIGALAPRKSHHLFIDAAAHVLREGRDVQFLIIGGGPLRGTLQQRIDDLGVGDRIRLVGFQPRIEPILRIADVCVKPGIVEGFIGITVLEAQARGVPVVAFDTEDVRLAIRDGDTGIIVGKGDSAAMANAIKRLLDEPAMAAELSKRALDRVQRFSIERVAEQLEQLYATRGQSSPAEVTPW